MLRLQSTLFKNRPDSELDEIKMAMSKFQSVRPLAHREGYEKARQLAWKALKKMIEVNQQQKSANAKQLQNKSEEKPVFLTHSQAFIDSRYVALLTKGKEILEQCNRDEAKPYDEFFVLAQDFFDYAIYSPSPAALVYLKKILSIWLTDCSDQTIISLMRFVKAVQQEISLSSDELANLLKDFQDSKTLEGVFWSAIILYPYKDDKKPHTYIGRYCQEMTIAEVYISLQNRIIASCIHNPVEYAYVLSHLTLEERNFIDFISYSQKQYIALLVKQVARSITFLRPEEAAVLTKTDENFITKDISLCISYLIGAQSEWFQKEIEDGVIRPEISIKPAPSQSELIKGELDKIKKAVEKLQSVNPLVHREGYKKAQRLAWMALKKMVEVNQQQKSADTRQLENKSEEKPVFLSQPESFIKGQFYTLLKKGVEALEQYDRGEANSHDDFFVLAQDFFYYAIYSPSKAALDYLKEILSIWLTDYSYVTIINLMLFVKERQQEISLMPSELGNLLKYFLDRETLEEVFWTAIILYPYKDDKTPRFYVEYSYEDITIAEVYASLQEKIIENSIHNAVRYADVISRLAPVDRHLIDLISYSQYADFLVRHVVSSITFQPSEETTVLTKRNENFITEDISLCISYLMGAPGWFQKELEERMIRPEVVRKYSQGHAPFFKADAPAKIKQEIASAPARSLTS
jgi:hypothetical protein